MPDQKSLYNNLPADFFVNAKNSLNPISRWLHRTRYSTIKNWVSEFYKPGMKILDMGCGSCLWNEEKLPVFGIDLNQKLLETGKKGGFLMDYVSADFLEFNFQKNKFDIIICSEIIEHLNSPAALLKKINSVLQDSGILIVTVPYDTNLSPFRPLFFMQCFFWGNLMGDPYYKNKCGHINHFSPASIIHLANSCGFSPIKIKTPFRMNIALVFKKQLSNQTH